MSAIPIKKDIEYLKVYLLRVAESDSVDLSLFSQDEQKVIESYKRKENQLLKAGLFLLIDKFIRKPILKSQYGKPYLLSGPNISISDCYPYVLLTVSDCLLGTDIEKETDFSTNLLNECFTPNELKSSLDPTLLWTIKEASYKVKGDKPFNPLKDEVIIKSKDTICFNQNTYKFIHRKIDDFYYSIVLEDTRSFTKPIEISYSSLVRERKTI